MIENERTMAATFVIDASFVFIGLLSVLGDGGTSAVFPREPGNWLGVDTYQGDGGSLGAAAGV